MPREAVRQGFSLVAVDEAVVRVAFRLICDTRATVDVTPRGEVRCCFGLRRFLQTFIG